MLLDTASSTSDTRPDESRATRDTSPRQGPSTSSNTRRHTTACTPHRTCGRGHTEASDSNTTDKTGHPEVVKSKTNQNQTGCSGRKSFRLPRAKLPGRADRATIQGGETASRDAGILPATEYPGPPDQTQLDTCDPEAHQNHTERSGRETCRLHHAKLPGTP